ncbi:MAG: DNA (cytosine-5-)-methyltransferase [PVC group bacterium]|nr:DNA (cytosine-5-)-methyltransferase [PVC group bacterium]
MKIKNVLSLFDGISTGRLALDMAGIEYDNYYCSEIDKTALAIAKYNYPDSIYLGDVTKIKASDLPKIDLLIGGFPCQDTSLLSGKGKGLAGKKSKLFYEFLRLKKELKPKYYLVENVIMDPRTKSDITMSLGNNPLLLCSSHFSAQKRRRYYWTNIAVNQMPPKNTVVLGDILQKDSELSQYEITPIICENGYKNAHSTMNINLFESSNRQIKTAADKACALVGTRRDRPKLVMKSGKTCTFNTSNDKIGCVDRKTAAVTGSRYDFSGRMKVVQSLLWARMLTIKECERLQTMPDDYTKYGIDEDGKIYQPTDAERYFCLKNGWTAKTISWIFSFMK